jgi:hypothetical protein
LRQSLLRVADYRGIALADLKTVLADYAGIAQQRWLAWLRKQRMESTVPMEFSEILGLIVNFADPVIAGEIYAHTWDSDKQFWI